jgi:rhamnose utilization protein RhaD (predicted bifunctional aldolase and dehydrogenase)
MNSITDTLKASVINYCSTIGKDPLLVQGAGGNVSWKEGNTLWIKASGTWLADADKKDIFVPVDLPYLRSAIKSGDFTVKPKVLGVTELRPSIETVLHALMPHRVVVHLHAIEILAHLVRNQFEDDFHSLLNCRIEWCIVPYEKPGADLAKAVNLALSTKQNADVIFLANHGVVIGADSVEEVEQLLDSIIESLRVESRCFLKSYGSVEPLSINGQVEYFPLEDQDIYQLVTEVNLFDRLKTDWALYPDHVVFLGIYPNIYANIDVFLTSLINGKEMPELVFIRNLGVFTRKNFSVAKQLQLRCYYDVLVRQYDDQKLNILDSRQVRVLLNWDAEQYRIEVAK